MNRSTPLNSTTPVKKRKDNSQIKGPTVSATGIAGRFISDSEKSSERARELAVKLSSIVVFLCEGLGAQ